MKKSDRYDLLKKLLAERILILDGAMGTMIQREGLAEADFQGRRFASHPVALIGDNDLLCLTRPDLIRDIHLAYLDAGADIAETNSFNANAISQADYRLSDISREIARESAKIARAACDEVEARDPSRPRFVAGCIGPTNKTLSMSPDVRNPGFRAISFDELSAAYEESIRGLIEGGADILLIETVFDTLNAKSAVWAAKRIFAESGIELPLMISGTITDASGRTLSGQTPTAFWYSLRHADPFSIGFNCSLGAEGIVKYVEEVGRLADTALSVHPNAGLPNEMGQYDDTPENMARILRAFALKSGVNIVGGCCGTTPGHIKAISEALHDIPPRRPVAARHSTCLSGLEPLEITPESLFVNIGERTNVSGSKKFARLIRDGLLPEAVEIAREQVEAGAQAIDVNMDEAMLDSEKEMCRFLDLIATEPDIARVPVMIDSSKWATIFAGLKHVQGKSIVNSISLKEGEEAFLEKARIVRALGAAVVVMAFDEKGQADSLERKISICARAYRLLVDNAGLSPPRHPPRSEYLRYRHGDRRAPELRPRFLQGRVLRKEEPCRRPRVGRSLERLLQLSGQRPFAKRHPCGLPLPRQAGGHGYRDRESRAARLLRRHRRRSPGSDRGPRPEPPGRCDREAARGGRKSFRRRERRG